MSVSLFAEQNPDIAVCSTTTVPSVDDEARRALRAHFTDARGKPIKTPYYTSQLYILYEDMFFPWVVSRALRALEGEGFLKTITLRDLTVLQPWVYMRIHRNIPMNVSDSVSEGWGGGLGRYTRR